MTEPEKESVPHVKEPVSKEPPLKDPGKELQGKIESILKEYKGMESDIPMNHEYWSVKAQLDAVRRAKGE